MAKNKSKEHGDDQWMWHGNWYYSSWRKIQKKFEAKYFTFTLDLYSSAFSEEVLCC